MGCPKQFSDYIRYCRTLKFDAKPNMTYLRGLFKDLYKEKYSTETTTAWDWEKLPQKRGSLKGKAMLEAHFRSQYDNFSTLPCNEVPNVMTLQRRPQTRRHHLLRLLRH